MSKINSLKLALATSGFLSLTMLAVPLANHHLSMGNFDLISSAHAADDGGSGKKQSGKTQGGSTGDHGTVKGSGKGKKDIMTKGQGGPGDDSDRPIWAGVKGGKAGAGGKPAGGGTKKGDLYGDLWIILRNEDGVPILSAAGFVQPIAADGTLIPLDAEGAPIDASLTQEVEFSRLSVARAPSKVLTHSLDEAISKITAGTLITLDAAGRVVIDGDAIDSPLENLALYKAIMTNTLPTAVAAKLPANLAPSSLLAAGADKTSTVNVDVVVYLNSFLGVNTVVDGKVTSYYDFTTDYDRYATYKDVTAQVLVLQADGVTYKTETVNIYDTVFSGSTWVDPTPASAGADDFAAATNDALRVIQYVHDNEVR
jgi:hypothetical protein